MQLFATLMLAFLLTLPWTMTAARPLTVRVEDADKDPVPDACVTEVWTNHSDSSGISSGTVRSDTLGLARFPRRTATASGWWRVTNGILRLVSRISGRTPRPAVFVTVLGPEYQGEASDLRAAKGVVSVVVRTEVQSPVLRARFARTCAVDRSLQLP